MGSFLCFWYFVWRKISHPAFIKEKVTIWKVTAMTAWEIVHFPTFSPLSWQKGVFEQKVGLLFQMQDYKKKEKEKSNILPIIQTRESQEA